jgi:hypothetical protein
MFFDLLRFSFGFRGARGRGAGLIGCLEVKHQSRNYRLFLDSFSTAKVAKIDFCYIL